MLGVGVILMVLLPYGTVHGTDVFHHFLICPNSPTDRQLDCGAGKVIDIIWARAANLEARLINIQPCGNSLTWRLIIDNQVNSCKEDLSLSCHGKQSCVVSRAMAQVWLPACPGPLSTSGRYSDVLYVRYTCHELTGSNNRATTTTAPTTTATAATTTTTTPTTATTTTTTSATTTPTTTTTSATTTPTTTTTSTPTPTPTSTSTAVTKTPNVRNASESKDSDPTSSQGAKGSTTTTTCNLALVGQIVGVVLLAAFSAAIVGAVVAIIYKRKNYKRKPTTTPSGEKDGRETPGHFNRGFSGPVEWSNDVSYANTVDLTRNSPIPPPMEDLESEIDDRYEQIKTIDETIPGKDDKYQDLRSATRERTPGIYDTLVTPTREENSVITLFY